MRQILYNFCVFRLEVSISRLLTAAVSSQPGLLRAFLSPPDSLMTSITRLLHTHAKVSCDQHHAL